MAKRRRIKVSLNDNEVVVVGPLPMWEHLIGVYEEMANDHTGADKEAWLDAACWIREWVSKSREETDEW